MHGGKTPQSPSCLVLSRSLWEVGFALDSYHPLAMNVLSALGHACLTPEYR